MKNSIIQTADIDVILSCNALSNFLCILLNKQKKLRIKLISL